MLKLDLHVMWALGPLAGLISGCGSGPAVPPAVPAPSSSSSSVPSPSVPEPSPSEPVKARMVCRPATVKGGDSAELVVAVRIAKAHYLHAEADHGGKFTPLGMEVTLPTGMEFVGDWRSSPPETGRAGVPVFRDSARLRRSLKVTSLPPQALSVTGVLRYQACNDELCWPPGKLELSAPLAIQDEATR